MTACLWNRKVGLVRSVSTINDSGWDLLVSIPTTLRLDLGTKIFPIQYAPGIGYVGQNHQGVKTIYILHSTKV
jgi:hypothetical protein